MIILFSRHAKRRAKLYGFSEEDLKLILRDVDLKQGRQELLKKVEFSRYPIKLVVDVNDDIITVITSYPFKKGVNS
jgi:hypothetical protein